MSDRLRNIREGDIEESLRETLRPRGLGVLLLGAGSVSLGDPVGESPRLGLPAGLP